MRVLITGASGFVGRWLAKALTDGGHAIIDIGTEVDVTDRAAIGKTISGAAPDAIVHLAAVAFAPDASADPGAAYSVAIGGTVNVLEAVRTLPRPSVVLVTGSSEVYGEPHPDDLPLRESSALRPRSPYSLSKAAQESVALAYAARYGLSIVVTRSFNHTGPGQRPVFVVPALAGRVRAFAAGEAPDIPVGNLDVRRDLMDVRDVTDAYRRILEAQATGGVAVGGLVLNVCSGRSVAIRDVLDELCRLAGVEPVIRVDPKLVRANDPAEIRGDATAVQALTGWAATTPLTKTLADVWAALPGPTTRGA